VLAVRYAGDVEDGVLIFERVEAGVVAEGALSAKLVEVNIAFEDDPRVGWDFEVDCFALHQLDGTLAQESGNEEFLDLGRGRDNGAESQRGFGADGDGDFHLAGRVGAFGRGGGGGGCG